MNDLAKNPDTFCGDEPTTSCRVCGGTLTETQVTSGKPPYRTSWRLCAMCESWSIERKPEIDRLNIFYRDYALHNRKAAVNPGNNDGRRYTEAWRLVREHEYQLGIKDCGLELKAGQKIVDFGAYDGIFLDVCRELEPDLAHTTIVDYPREEVDSGLTLEHRFQTIDDWLEGSSTVDVVALWDVYEHVTDLDTLLQALSRRVIKGGQVVVQTPRAHQHAHILQERWHHFLPVQHLQLPSRAGLLQQFEKVGFRMVTAGSFGANAPADIIPEPYKKLFDTLAKQGDLGSTQLIRFVQS